MESAGSSSDFEAEPPVKTRKLDGAAKYPTKFNSEWRNKWPCIQSTSTSKYKFVCTLCQCLVSCEHQGERDVRRHIEGKKHCDNIRGLEGQQQIGTFFRPASHPIHEKVTRAEVKVTTLLAHHNIPIAFSDHLSPLFKEIFPDSEIAKAYSCARTKTTCILNGALATSLRKSLIDQMKVEPFSLATDGSNDSGLQKMNPLTVRYFDVNRGKVTSQLLDMCLTSASTAESIYTKINDTMKLYDIDWGMCVAFGVDNTNVNIGRRNSIRSRVHEENGNVYFVGCPCHMVHNTACKAAEVFQKETGFDVEDILVDLFYWFDKSTKRKNELSSFCEFCNIQYRQVVKHVSTRWLSLEYAVDRTLLQYSGLRSYFLSCDETQARFERLRKHFDQSITEVYLMFYQSVIPAFTSINLFLQRESPCIHLVHDKLESFIRNILGKFVKVSVLQHLDNENLITCDFSSEENQLNNSQIFIGFTTRLTLNQLVHDGSISNCDVRKFYNGVRQFYIRSVQYIIVTYPLNDDLLRHARFLNFEKRSSVCFDAIEYFIHRYRFLLHPLTAPREMELLQEEFVSYQLLRESDIPSDIWDAAKVGEAENRYYSMDVIWGYLCKLQCIGSFELKFGRLCKVAKVVLVIPHSNASEERVFSMVRKNKTPFRPSIGLDGTLSSIITVKLGLEDPCYKFEPSKALLDNSKKATWEYNKSHSSRHISS